jgi:cold shock CspA family protein
MDAALVAHIRVLESTATTSHTPRKTPTMLGTVSYYAGHAGFGFVQPDGTEGRDQTIYVGARTINEAGLARLTVGDRLEFSVRGSRHKPGKSEAFDIKIAA